ncbi:hypothetical protein PCANB_002859 [Pneumocystis canis]|nr:hypothetical protein PCANB_002859 [Pneumocystis canis]
MHVTRYPARSLRANITPYDWKNAVYAWIRCMRYCLTISEYELERIFDKPTNSSLGIFIQDYLNAHTPRKYENLQNFISDPIEDILLGEIFLLLHRILTSERLCTYILKIPFVLFDFCALFAFDSTENVFYALKNVYQCAEKDVFIQTYFIRDEFQGLMNTLVSLSDEALMREALTYRISLQALTLFIRLCFSATCVFLEDEDFLRSIACLYHRGTIVNSIKPDLLYLVFTLFTSFLCEDWACLLIVKRFTWLYEQLSLEKELLRDLVLDTSIVECFYEVELFSEEIVTQLKNLKQNSKSRNMGNTSNSDLDTSAQRLYLISHIKDMFPEYGEGFIDMCLIEYHDNVETVISHILENSFPPHISMIDKKASRLDIELSRNISKALVTRENNLNAFGDFSRIYKKKKGYDNSFIREHKQTILNLALADDDEKDDMYDDVGELSDIEIQDRDDFLKSNNMDEILYATYIVSPEVFDRSSQTRKSSGRMELRSKTGLSDEQIEGWKIMLDRNPRYAEKIENMLDFTGNQVLSSVEWKKDQNEEFNKKNWS